MAKRASYDGEVRTRQEGEGDKEENVYENERAGGSEDPYLAPDPYKIPGHQGSRTQEVTRDQDLTKGQRDEERGQKRDTEDSGQLEERVVDIYESVNLFGLVPRPLQVMRDNPAGRDTQGQRSKPVRRTLIVTMCLGMLCLMLLGAVIGLTVHYNSAYTILTLEINNLQSSYENLTQERKGLQSSYANLTLWINQSTVNKLTEENDMLQRRVNQLTQGKGCPCGWQKFGDGCYYRSTEKNTWDESRQQCQKIGADLVIINSKEEQEFIRGLGPVDETSWIGLEKTDGNWTWLDGTVTTGDWYSGWPTDHTGYNCAKYWHNAGKSTNPSCEERNYWICEN